MTGVFVVFEGGDGVGKSTQVRLLSEWLASRGHDVVTTFEPGDTAVGRQIRRLLLDPATGDLDPRAEALLYAADKAHHLHEVIEPALARDAVVISDRYVDSMLAYQGAGRVLNLADVTRLARWATRGRVPDLTVLLDLEPERALGGIARKDRLEDAGGDFHTRVRGFFLDLAQTDPDRYLVLPGRWSRERIATAVHERMLPLLARTGARLRRPHEVSGPPDTLEL